MRSLFCRVVACNLAQGLTAQHCVDLGIAASADPVVRSRRDKILAGVRSGRDLPTMLVKAKLVDPGDLLLLCASDSAGLLGVALFTVVERCQGRLRDRFAWLRLVVNLSLTVVFLFVSGKDLYRSYQDLTSGLGGATSGEVEKLLKSLGDDSPIPMKDLEELQNLIGSKKPKGRKEPKDGKELQDLKELKDLF